MRFIGCKNQLLEQIKIVIDKHCKNCESLCDVFSGTATVARYFKQFYEVYSNDLLYFSYCLQKGTIENDTVPNFETLNSKLKIDNPICYLNNVSSEELDILDNGKRFFQNNYSPKGNRMYLTEINALRIDYSRNKVQEWFDNNLITENEYFYLIACIVEGIPYVSNISGTYGAFNKHWDVRSNKKYQLIEVPVFTNQKHNQCFNENGVDLVAKISGDILYIDPPYNERQYLPNYHVLETAAKYDKPTLKGVTGQRSYENQKSEFCSKKTVISAFEQLIKNARFKHIIMSYNTDGIMNVDDIEMIMKKYGLPETFEISYIPYRRFKSRRNVTNTNELKEMLIYIEKRD